MSAFSGRILCLLAAACAPTLSHSIEVIPPTAETIALTGDTLWSLPLNAAQGPERVARLKRARAEVAKDSFNLWARLNLAHSTAAMGRLREAVNLLSEARWLVVDDPELYRYRGELLLWLREPNRAIPDFQHAGRLGIGQSARIDVGNWVSGGEELSTLEYATKLLLGFTYYCNGDYAKATEALSAAAESALTPDQMSRAVLWLFFAARRTGVDAGAAVLQLVQESWAKGARHQEIDLLLAFKGLLPSDSIRSRALRANEVARPLYGYGIAYYLELLPDHGAEAEAWLDWVRSGPDWTALPYLAAEADLARLRGTPQKRKVIIRP